MTRQQVIALVAADMKAVVLAAGGAFFVAGNPQDPFVMLTSGNFNKWACILAYAGDRPANEAIEGALFDVTLEFYVGHTIDLRKDPGAWLYVDSSATAKALMARVDEVDAKALTIVFQGTGADDAAYARYGGCQIVTLPGIGVPLRAMKLSYTYTLRLEPDAASYRFLNA